MTIWTLIGIIALVAVVVFLKRGSGNRSAPSATVAARTAGARTAVPDTAVAATDVPKIKDNFTGVMVFAEKDACAVVQRLTGKIFPENRIPRIPVEGCDQGQCECRVHRIKGRRSNARRISHDRRGDIRFDDERREHQDRRAGIETWQRPVD